MTSTYKQYQHPEIQDIADYVNDSIGLSRRVILKGECKVIEYRYKRKYLITYMLITEVAVGL